jgi:hypothetical protein
MKNCWAAHLGNCSHGMSREHIVSMNLFSYDPPRGIEVSGFPWLGDEKKILPIGALTSNILCERHNNALSVADVEGGNLFHAFQEISHAENMIKSKTSPVSFRQYKLDGRLLERWFLKTTINFMCQQKYPIGDGEPVSGMPSTELVEIAFGERSFKAQCGLYLIHSAENINSFDRLEFAAYFKSDMSYIAGGIFLLRGFRFLVFFGHEDSPNLTDIQLGDTDLSSYRLFFHPEQLRFTDGSNELYREIVINW